MSAEKDSMKERKKMITMVDTNNKESDEYIDELFSKCTVPGKKESGVSWIIFWMYVLKRDCT